MTEKFEFKNMNEKFEMFLIRMNEKFEMFLIFMKKAYIMMHSSQVLWLLINAFKNYRSCLIFVQISTGNTGKPVDKMTLIFEWVTSLS